MIAIPAMVNYFNLKQLLENLMVRWTGWLCHQLRLSSFLLGKRPIKEEGYIYYKSWKAWIQRPELNDDADGVATFVKSGHLVRAPKHDSVRYVPGRRMLVPVDPVTFEPTDQFERELGHPAGDEENNTTIIYLPPRFKLRMTLFMFIMWVSWCIFICCLFVGPIALGRWMFDCFDIQTKSIHDIYAYFFGGIVLIFIGVLIKQFKNLITSVSSLELNWVSNSEAQEETITITRSESIYIIIRYLIFAFFW
jgi:E3 ubiquitin-protein ligase DOA10